MSQKRSRSINWDEEEKQLLRNVLREYISIIANKSLESNINQMKIKAWSAVHSRFNSLNSRERTLKQIQTQWKMMKMECRKHLSVHRVELRQTGGGSKPKSPTMQDLNVASMVPGELTRTCNEFDSDGGSIAINVIDTCHTLDKTESEAQDDIQISLDHEVEQVHITTQMMSEIPPLAHKLANVQQGPSTSYETPSTSYETPSTSCETPSTSYHTPSTSQGMPAQAPQRLCATVRSKSKGKGKKTIKWNYKMAMFRLAKRSRELDHNRKMKEHQMLRAKHAMEIVEHELKVKILKKQLEQLDNKK